MTKKSIKVDSFIWVAENGHVEYGIYIGDGDEPVSFSTSLKELVRDTLTMYMVGTVVHSDHREDVKQMIKSFKAATELAEQELKRMGNE